METSSQFLVMTSKSSRDEVRIYTNDVKLTDSEEGQRRFTDSLDLNVENKERTRLRLFQFPFAIKLEIGLNVFPWDPSPLGRISLPLQVQIFYDHVNPATRRIIDQSAGGKLRDKNAKESWALIEDLALYDNERWNDPRDFAKPVKAISLPCDIPNASDRRLIELENQVQRLMKAHLAHKPSI
ncbi:hypothetical protein Tco_1176957 [Tanacetum coccineum]